MSCLIELTERASSGLDLDQGRLDGWGKDQAGSSTACTASASSVPCSSSAARCQSRAHNRSSAFRYSTALDADSCLQSRHLWRFMFTRIVCPNCRHVGATAASLPRVLTCSRCGHDALIRSGKPARPTQEDVEMGSASGVESIPADDAAPALGTYTLD